MGTVSKVEMGVLALTPQTFSYTANLRILGLSHGTHKGIINVSDVRNIHFEQKSLSFSLPSKAQSLRHCLTVPCNAPPQDQHDHHFQDQPGDCYLQLRDHLEIDYTSMPRDTRIFYFTARDFLSKTRSYLFTCVSPQWESMWHALRSFCRL